VSDATTKSAAILTACSALLNQIASDLNHFAKNLNQFGGALRESGRGTDSIATGGGRGGTEPPGLVG
jgi:hypothetical protein